MNPGASPLLELFRTGDIDGGLRLLASRGGLMPQAGDDIALLTILTRDRDPQVARTAQSTLDALDPARAAVVASERGRPVAPEQSRGTSGDAAEPLGAGPADALANGDSSDLADEPRESTRTRVGMLGLTERVLLALRGTRAERAVLVTDPNRAVGLAALSSPGMTESEVEGITRMPQVHEDVLRAIATQRVWVRHYGVVVGLVRNPRTPAAVSMNLLPRLQDRDLRLASTDRNIPDIVRVTARRKLVGA